MGKTPNLKTVDDGKKGGKKVERKKTAVRTKAKKAQQQLPPEQHRRRARYVGVHWHKREKKWRAMIILSDGTSKSLGLHKDEKEAARMYDEQAALLGRPVNFPLHEGMEQAVKRVLKGSTHEK